MIFLGSNCSPFLLASQLDLGFSFVPILMPTGGPSTERKDEGISPGGIKVAEMDMGSKAGCIENFDWAWGS